MADAAVFRAGATAFDTPRLHVREPVDADAPVLLAYFTRNEERFAPWEPARSPDVAYYANWIRWRAAERSVQRGLSFLAFDRARPDALVGTLNLYNIELRATHAAMAGYNFDGAYEGRGYAREAVGAIVAHLFATLGLKKVLANYDPRNVRSGALLRRLGFVVEGYSRDHLYLRGTWRDSVLTSLTNPDWAPPSA